MVVGRPHVTGLVLAAGAGRRFGGPKALVPGWLPERITALHAGGCAAVLVVVGAAAEQARDLVPPSARVVVADHWQEGMGASLRAGLEALEGSTTQAALIALVDTPGVTAAAVARLVAAAGPDPLAALAQAAYDGRPGHPVLIGRRHWPGVAAAARGDRGARDYLAAHPAALVECADVADGRDIDTPAADEPVVRDP